MTSLSPQSQVPTEAPPGARPAPMPPDPRPPRGRFRGFRERLKRLRGRFRGQSNFRGWGRVLVHLVLLAGLALFLFPFLWMVSTSVKTDEELTRAAMLPNLPTFTEASPYVRQTPEPNRPYDAPPQVWREALPELRRLAEATIAPVQAASALGQLAAGDIDPPAHRAAAANLLVEQTVGRLHRAYWTGPDAELLDAFARELSPSAAEWALFESLARLEFLQIQLSTLDLRVVTLDRGSRLAQRVEVEQGESQLVDLGDSALLRYRFVSPDAEPVVLRYAFAMPDGVTMENLHKLTVSLKPDDSWHAVDATLDVEGRRWTSQRTTPLAQHRVMSITFQPPTFDDETARAKTWVPIRVAGAAPAGARAGPPGFAVLRLIISPAGTPEAVGRKLVRNYERAFHSVPFWRYILNSALLVGLSVGGALFSSAFVAYAFARLRWPGRSVAFALLLSTMMLPAQVTMIPSFVIWRTVGWYNTLNPLWVPAWFGSAFFVFLMVQHMKTVPRELEEAARIDGLNAMQSWWYVILPQVRPSMAAIAILSFMGAWNEFMGPLIYLRDQDRFPLALGLFGMRVDQGGDWTMMMAGNVLMTLPIIVVFFLFQRYFVQGMAMTGMKG